MGVGRMGVWERECESMGGWECGRMGVWEGGSMGVWEGQSVRMGSSLEDTASNLVLFLPSPFPLSSPPISLFFLLPFLSPQLSLKPAVSVILHWFWKGLSLSTSVAPHSWESGSLSSPLSTKSSQQEGKALSVTVKNSILQYITVYYSVLQYITVYYSIFRSRAHKNRWLE